jgi:hypothetical protein
MYTAKFGLSEVKWRLRVGIKSRVVYVTLFII